MQLMCQTLQQRQNHKHHESKLSRAVNCIPQYSSRVAFNALKPLPLHKTRGRCQLHIVKCSTDGTSPTNELASEQSVPEEEEHSSAIPTRLNNIPHQRDTRRWFYRDCREGVMKAVKAGEKRMQVKLTIPETNPEMDVYRIGTLLELVREVATALAQDGKRVKVCVQQALGSGTFKGMPLSLSGVSRIAENMDWGDILEFVSFGSVAADQVDDSEFYILVSPQNIVGGCIVTSLFEMVQEVEEQGKCIILVNPILKDIPSSSGVMNIRGRKERIDFAESFTPAYHFRLLFMSSAMMYPIMGCVRHQHGGPWEIFRRVDLGKRQEEYQPLGTFDSIPVGNQITNLFSSRKTKSTGSGWW